MLAQEHRCHGSSLVEGVANVKVWGDRARTLAKHKRDRWFVSFWSSSRNYVQLGKCAEGPLEKRCA